MLASQRARYSGVSGGFCARPGRLVSSHEFTVPGARLHWPDQSGYLDSSNAAALAAVIASAAIAVAARFAVAPIVLRNEIMGFLRRVRSPNAMRVARAICVGSAPPASA